MAVDLTLDRLGDWDLRKQDTEGQHSLIAQDVIVN